MAGEQEVTLPEYYEAEASLYARQKMSQLGSKDREDFDRYFYEYLQSAICHSLTAHMGKDDGEVIFHLPWVELILSIPAKERKKWVAQMLEGLKTYREGASKPKGSKWLSDWVGGKDFDLIGFAPNIQYVKVDGSLEELKALWVHPWGSPVLVYKHKHLPMITLVGPSIRLDETVMSEDDEEDVLGFTG